MRAWKAHVLTPCAAAAMVLASCTPSPVRRGQSVMLDLTYPFSASSIYWPTGNAFESTRVAYGVNGGGWFYASNDYSANEHGGTHVDAPIHFAEGGRSIEQIGLAEWVGPATVIDVTLRCTADRDYRLTAVDVQAWEANHGAIPRGAWVLMYTGIGTRYYPNRKEVLGTDAVGPEAVAELRFPGFGEDAVEYLLANRDITGIGLDTPSIDYGRSTDFLVHRRLLGAGKLAIENIANLDRLPAVGATLYAVPMLIEGGTGAPARVFATFARTASRDDA